MKTQVRNKLLFALLLCFGISIVLGAVAITSMQQQAFAETTNQDITDNIVITDTADEVLAEYLFTVINDNECSVRISNKTVATKAVIPSTAEINGKKYKVTQVAANGFMSAAKLTRVSLPHTIKKVGNMAFANCTALKRISLSNVEELGANVFYKCTSLERLVLPDSLVTVGATILRSTNTQVLARSASAKEGWVSNWNSGNTNQEVEYSSKYIEPLELETVYAPRMNTMSRAASGELELAGYYVAGGQPFSAKFYAEEGNNVFIPSLYQNEYILGISSSAFEGANFDQLVIEYSMKTLKIGDYAFLGATCKYIVINRPVEFTNENGTPSNNVFALSSDVEAIVLPDTVSGIADQAFAGCISLTNVYFSAPYYFDRRSDALNLIDRLVQEGEVGVVKLPQNTTFSTLGESAFMDTAVQELHIYDNVKNVGADILLNEGDTTRKIYVYMAEDEIPAPSSDSTQGWHANWSRGISENNLHFVTNRRNVTFNPCGGTVSPASKKVEIGSAMGTLPVPERTHYVFTGWYDSDNNLYTSETTFSLQIDLELFAHWQEFTYTIEYNGNRPNTASKPLYGNMSATETSYSNYISLNAIGYSIEGWSFTGWNTQANGKGIAYGNAELVSKLCEDNNGTVQLFAQWTPNIYSVKYNANYDTAEVMDNSAHVYDRASYLSSNTFNRLGYTFAGWNTQSDGQGTSFVDQGAVTDLNSTHNGVTELYAQWTINVYNIKYKN